MQNSEQGDVEPLLDYRMNGIVCLVSELSLLHSFYWDVKSALLCIQFLISIRERVPYFSGIYGQNHISWCEIRLQRMLVVEEFHLNVIAFS